MREKLHMLQADMYDEVYRNTNDFFKFPLTHRDSIHFQLQYELGLLHKNKCTYPPNYDMMLYWGSMLRQP